MKPLRELTKKEVAWMWDPIQQQALENLKKAVSSTPVLRYYNLQEEVTLQCDASLSGLGATLMQNGQPVAYASRALTRYAQIEKELLAIVFGCEHFEAYTYGRDVVQVETDHQPLCGSHSTVLQVDYSVCYSGYRSSISKSNTRRAKKCFWLTCCVTRG